MDKETIALIIAQNGLGTASTLLAAKSAKLKKQLDKEGDDVKRAALEKKITKAEHLSTALRIANEGIVEYQVAIAE
jgi:hypothetical protein